MSTLQSPSVVARFALIRPLLASPTYQRWVAKLRRRAARRRTLRMALLLSNVVILAVILVFVLGNPRSSEAVITPSALDNANQNSANANPLDQLSSANIALTVAQLTSLPETTAVANQAESETADLAIISNSDNVLTKPQVVATALKSRADIQAYVTQSGDTLASLAAKFGVTSDSIRWSNNLSGSTLAAGVKLEIPPVNGIVYTVKAGDTPATLAQKFSANQAQIIAYNDAEISGLQPGELIIIPNGTQATVATSVFSPGFAWGTGPLYGFNGYDFGFCTWYVATQVSVPGNWGNASSWAYYARLSGWNVSSTPTVGAIAQTPYAAGGEGHVGVVDGVSPNGDQVHVRDMNNYGDGGGFDRVGSSWVATSTYPNYISR
jgi:surface antigen